MIRRAEGREGRGVGAVGWQCKLGVRVTHTQYWKPKEEAKNGTLKYHSGICLVVSRVSCEATF